MNGISLSRSALGVAAIFAMIGASGCGSDPAAGASPGSSPDAVSPGGSGGAASDTAWGAGGDVTADTPPPFSTPFTALVSQSVPWSSLDVAVVGAGLERGSDSTQSPAQTFAALDLAITNNDTSEVDYQTRDTWDLVLAGGDRVRSIDALGVLISPTDTAKTKLHYPVPDGTTLAGAALLIAGDPRGSLEPERIPLDAIWQPHYPLALPLLVGKKVTTPDPASVSHLEIEVTDAFVDLNDPTGARASFGNRLVRMDVIATHHSTSTGADTYLGGEAFRVVIDGHSYAPDNFINYDVRTDAAIKVHVVFTIAADTKNFEILFNVPGITERFPVDVDQDGKLSPN